MRGLFNFKRWKTITGELKFRWWKDRKDSKKIVEIVQSFLLRGARGWSDTDYLEANKHIALVTKNVLRDLRTNSDDCPEDISQEDWNDQLKIMIKAWEKMYHYSIYSEEAINYLGQRDLDIGMYLFESNFQNLKEKK